MNIYAAISKGSKVLNNNSILSAQLDAELLMAHAVNKDRHKKLTKLKYLKIINVLIQIKKRN